MNRVVKSVPGDRRFVFVVAAAWLLFIAAVYLPDLGRGFVRDDFAWIEAGRTILDKPLNAIVPDVPGFYRPLVSLSFSVDFALHGLAPRGYGWSNLALFLGCAIALWNLSRRVGLSAGGASVAVLAWSANPHGINMALVWLSGRTALCLTLFAILAATAVLQRRYVCAAAALAAALASKEEAVVLPVILFVWHELFVPASERDSERRIALRMALAGPLVGYLLMRQFAGAFTPASAPPFYRSAFAPSAVLSNALEYLDRGATISIILIGLAAISQRSTPTLTSHRVRVIAAAAVWFVAGYSITVFLPIRSSLYAVFPSVGAAIACGALVESIRTRATASSRVVVPLEAVVAASLVLATPLYQQRNDRWVEPARLSHRALTVIQGTTPPLPERGAIVLHDVRDPASSFSGAFGTLATEAVRLYTGRDVWTWIEPRPEDWPFRDLTPPDPQSVVAHFTVDRGHVFRSDQ